jgi:hypothetical protein
LPWPSESVSIDDDGFKRNSAGTHPAYAVAIAGAPKGPYSCQTSAKRPSTFCGRMV